MSNIFGVDWFKGIAIKVNGKEAIIGTTTVQGDLYVARIDRPNYDPTKWMCDKFESKIHGNTFFMPFSAKSEQTYGCIIGSWHTITDIAIQTYGSLQRNYDTKEDITKGNTWTAYEKAITFDPPQILDYIEIK